MLQREDWLLLFVGAEGDRFETDQIRVMKGMFLLAKEGPQSLRNLYEFKPYDYGPFDKHVYFDLDRLEANGLIVSEYVPYTRRRTFRLTRIGAQRRQQLEAAAPAEALLAVRSVKRLVTSMGFMQLLEYVYARHPTFAARSVIHR